MFKGTKRGGGATDVDRGPLIKKGEPLVFFFFFFTFLFFLTFSCHLSAMALPQRQAPCLSCISDGKEGTALLLPDEFLFFVGTGQNKADVLSVVPLSTVSSYGIVDDKSVSIVSTERKKPLLLSPPDGQDSNWCSMVVIYLDIVMLRHLEVAEKTATSSNGPGDDLNFHKDFSAEDAIDSETLILDKRANRFKQGIATESRIIGGSRFPVSWKIRLKGLKNVMSVTQTDLLVPALLIPGDFGLILLLPQQKVLLPIYWQEIPSFGSKKTVFSLKHKIRQTEQLFVFESSGADALEKAVQAQLANARSPNKRPFPKLYPPTKNFSAAQLAVPLTSEETHAIETQSKSLAEKRYQLLKGQSKLIKPELKKEHFTMRFMANTLDVEIDDGGSDSDEAQDYLDMIDNQ